MTKQLEETFDLPESNPITVEATKSLMEILQDENIPDEDRKSTRLNSSH